MEHGATAMSAFCTHAAFPGEHSLSPRCHAFVHARPLMYMHAAHTMLPCFHARASAELAPPFAQASCRCVRAQREGRSAFARGATAQCSNTSTCPPPIRCAWRAYRWTTVCSWCSICCRRSSRTSSWTSCQPFEFEQKRRALRELLFTIWACHACKSFVCLQTYFRDAGWRCLAPFAAPCQTSFLVAAT